MDEAPDTEALLAQARARITGAPHPFLAGIGCLHLAQLQMSLSRPAEALATVAEGEGYLAALSRSSDLEAQRWVRMTSASAPPPGIEDGDPATLAAALGLLRVRALLDLGDYSAARVAADSMRPLTRGWGKRSLRRELGALDDLIARQDGTTGEALDALDRTVSDPRLTDDERWQARYERALRLVERDDFDDAVRESLGLVRDTDDPALLARARQVLGAALAGSGRVDDAVVSLRQAFEGFVALEDHAAVVTAAPGLSWQLSAQGAPADAAAIATRALSSARALGDLGAEADLLVSLATAQDLAGDSERAVADFDRAVTVAERIPDPVRAADARHGEAIARTHVVDRASPDDAVEALALLDAARVAYEQAGLPERAAGCVHEMAAILARLGSYDAARLRYEQARDSYQAIPEVLRGEHPGTLADCERNLQVLSRLPVTAPADAFSSGGHGMQYAGPT